MKQTASRSLEVARGHLRRVHNACDERNWTDLCVYGFACLEACVVAAVLHFGGQRPESHLAKAREARHLAAERGLPDVETLLTDLNTARKHEMYGDIEPSDLDLDSDEVAADIKSYFIAVEGLFKQ